MSSAFTHDTQGILGLLFSLAWGIAVAWRISERSKVRMDGVQDAKLVEVVSSTQSNEDNIIALQTALNTSLFSLNQNILALSQGIGDTKLDVQDLQSKADTTETNLSSLGSRLDSTISTLSNVEVGVTNAQNSITSLDAKVDNETNTLNTKIEESAASTLASANNSISTVETSLNAFKNIERYPVEFSFKNNDATYTAGSFLDIDFTYSDQKGALGIESGKFVVVPPYSAYTVIVALNYVQPDSYSLIELRTSGKSKRFGNQILTQQDINNNMGLRTIVASVNNLNSSETLSIGLNVNVAYQTGSAYLRAKNYSRMIFIPNM